MRKKSDRFEIAPICVRCWTCGRKSPCYVLFSFSSDTAWQTPEAKNRHEDLFGGCGETESDIDLDGVAVNMVKSIVTDCRPRSLLVTSKRGFKLWAIRWKMREKIAGEVRLLGYFNTASDFFPEIYFSIMTK